MTMGFSSAPLRARALGGHDVRRGLTALVRRRVPQQEVDDVAQTVLCDALASASVPTDPEELRRWLTGIARHKIADFHRRAARANARSSDAEPDEVMGRASDEPSALEVREVLHQLVGEERSCREAETMDWLLREHAGERLADIAVEHGVPAPVVRQRVSRLRRSIRSRWMGMFGLAVFVAGLSALGLVSYDAREVITADPASGAFASSSSSTLFREAEGDWVVGAVMPARPLNPNEKRLVDLQAKGTTLRVHDNKVELIAKGFKTSWQVKSLEKTSRGLRVRLAGEHGRVDVANVVFGRDSSGPRLDVELHDARFGGRVTLRRPAP